MNREPGDQGQGGGLFLVIRQSLACGLVVLLSSRIPGHGLAGVTSLWRDGIGAAAAEALLLLGVDGFGLLCALYFTHARIRGLSVVRCYPPNRLIPLSCHLLGLLMGWISLAPIP